MAGHLLGALEASVVLQVNRDAGCPPGVTFDWGEANFVLFSSFTLFSNGRALITRLSVDTFFLVCCGTINLRPLQRLRPQQPRSRLQLLNRRQTQNQPLHPLRNSK